MEASWREGHGCVRRTPADWALGDRGGRWDRRADQAGEQQDEQDEPSECLLASGGVKPLVKRMGSATGASGTECDRLKAEGEWDVGIGGGTLELRLDSELFVHCEDSGQKRRGGGQFSGRPLANQGDNRDEMGARARMCLSLGTGVSHGTAEELLELVEAQGIGGAEIDLEDGALGNGVDGGSALDASDVERGAWSDRQGDAGQGADEKAGGNNGIGRSVIAPGMAARAGDGYLKTAAAKSLRDDVIRCLRHRAR